VWWCKQSAKLFGVGSTPIIVSKELSKKQLFNKAITGVGRFSNVPGLEPGGCRGGTYTPDLEFTISLKIVRVVLNYLCKGRFVVYRNKLCCGSTLNRALMPTTVSNNLSRDSNVTRYNSR